jgi:hypothetical protein
MDLKATTKTYIVVSDNDLDAFIQHHTGRKGYHCVPCQEWSTGSKHTFHVDGKISDGDRRDYEAFKAGRHRGEWLLQYILDALCEDGNLAPGDYLVTVSW